MRSSSISERRRLAEIRRELRSNDQPQRKTPMARWASGETWSPIPTPDVATPRLAVRIHNEASGEPDHR